MPTATAIALQDAKWDSLHCSTSLSDHACKSQCRLCRASVSTRRKAHMNVPHQSPNRLRRYSNPADGKALSVTHARAVINFGMRCDVGIVYMPWHETNRKWCLESSQAWSVISNEPVLRWTHELSTVWTCTGGPRFSGAFMSNGVCKVAANRRAYGSPYDQAIAP